MKSEQVKKKHQKSLNEKNSNNMLICNLIINKYL